jgi:hypothetical protein
MSWRMYPIMLRGEDMGKVFSNMTEKQRGSMPLVMEEGDWALVNDSSYPITLSVLHLCNPEPNGNPSCGPSRVTCIGNQVSFREGICCGCSCEIPDSMLVLGRFTHWEKIYGKSQAG